MKTENTTAVGIILKSNIKIVEGGKLDTSTIKYMTDLFPGLVFLYNFKHNLKLKHMLYVFNIGMFIFQLYFKSQ
jgi:hypothetical protein